MVEMKPDLTKRSNGQLWVILVGFFLAGLAVAAGTISIVNTLNNSNNSNNPASVQGTISLQSISNCSEGCYQVSADFCNTQCSTTTGNTYATVTSVSNYTFHFSALLYPGTFYPTVGYVWYNSYHQEFIEHCFATVFSVQSGTLNLNQDISC